MDKRLVDVLNGKEDNYILPFYWQHGNHYEKIPGQIARIYASGCRALCVEARPHPEFCEAGWWRDMDRVIDECAKRGMKVWILDDKHFPTGYANGLIAAKYPDRRQWLLSERHVDVMGPMAGASLLVGEPSPEEPLVHVYAQKRLPGTDDQRLDGESVCLDAFVKNGMLCWDVPDGCWRVFILSKSRNGGTPDYIDLITAESAAVQIEAVYEPHYAHYARFFGNVIAGFFSDEPHFGNNLVRPHLIDHGMYEYRIGQEGLALPFNDRVLEMMGDELGEDAASFLGELWYESAHSHLTRLAYMNAITRLYRDCFSRPVGDWCRAHGVEYIGHIIEDMNAHGRMGYGSGHYFRALDGQDMGGIDIVLHQVMPGFADYMHSSTTAGGAASPAFFDYVLGKLGASISHQVPRMKGRAMCEVFGAYGWGEDATMMKWLMDFLLVRGINYFVPHAFSPDYPDPDCPPHFGAEGHDPQFEGFCAIMGYVNKMAHLLSGGRHIASAALLYHAEAEWMSAYGKAMLMQVPARVLYDAHIDYDIVPADVLLEGAHVADGRLCIGDETFVALVVPAAEYLPAPLVTRLGELRAQGLEVLFAGGVPSGIAAEATPVADLPARIRAMGGGDVAVDGDFPLLRCYHVVREGCDVFMLFNEAFAKPARTKLRLSVRGAFARLRLLDDFAASGDAPDGIVEVDLLPGQSEVLVFGDGAGLSGERRPSLSEALHPEYRIDLADSENLGDFKPYAVTDKLFNVNDHDHRPDFSGKIRYSFAVDLKAGGFDKATMLDLGVVGSVARVWVNGEYAGIRVAAPYRFGIGRFLREGRNDVVVESANTLAQKIKDYFSHYLQLRPAGMLGPVSLVR